MCGPSVSGQSEWDEWDILEHIAISYLGFFGLYLETLS